MEQVTVTREIAARPETVRAAMGDVESFMEAAKFDDVSVDGDTIRLANNVGLATIELTLEVVEGEGVLTYEQRDGIFEEMVTRYELDETESGVEVRATTEYELSASLVGPILDATVVKRQRRIELNAQFDYLESLAA